MSKPAQTPLDRRNTNSLWCGVLVETLVRLGLQQAIISPGSRSAPLTFAFARHPEVECIPLLDERSAGFFALGLAKQQRRPVVLVCTSGTAAANYLPAVVEAHESGVPLLVLTADRPPELRDCHSGQTIDQNKIYGDYVKHQHECAVPDASLAMLRYLRQTVVHAYRRTLAPDAGPVHLNCPFRDPLPPLADQATMPSEKAMKEFFNGISGETFPAVAAKLPPKRWLTRGVIVVGPNESLDGKVFARCVGRISRSLGWPVLADALSPVRMHAAQAGHVVVHYDTLLRDESAAMTLRPDQVICVGGWPTSKVLRAWLQKSDPEVMLLTERGANEDGLHLRTRVQRASLSAWSAGFSASRRANRFIQDWQERDRRVARQLSAALRRVAGLIEPKWPGVLAAELPIGTPCFIASSMPVRDAEYFWPAGNRGQRLFFNRGANGIDGTLSTAMGLAHGGSPTVLVTGDLALLHDTNGFLARPKLKGSLTIVLINNQGGGIFEHLPVAQFEPIFEEYFATPQQVDFAKLCAAYGADHVVIKDERQLGKLVAKLPRSGIRVLELRTNRKQDAAFRKQLFAKVAVG
jgi:2-succinyl-5-enolpyruvyl-6-hydroxy-3-cyclohexene-1-carboxylate synthase